MPRRRGISDAPFRTICGPPPMAFATPSQSGLRMKLDRRRSPPTSASASSAAAALPARDQHRAADRDRHRRLADAPPPPERLEVGVRAPRRGTGTRTAARRRPAPTGVAAPQAVVNSETWLEAGSVVQVVRARAGWPVPSHVAKNSTRRTSSVPSGGDPEARAAADGRTARAGRCAGARRSVSRRRRRRSPRSRRRPWLTGRDPPLHRRSRSHGRSGCCSEERIGGKRRGTSVGRGPVSIGEHDGSVWS